MAGVYGRLNSKADFLRVLDEALGTANYYRSLRADNHVANKVARELDAMKHWTAGGRVPTDDERDQVDIGLTAVRELNGGDTGDARADEWAKQLIQLNNFFEGWPTDAEAASSTDDDALRLVAKRRQRKMRRRHQVP